MKTIKLKAIMLANCIISAIRDWKIVCQGQNNNAWILQTSHRLEKGLIIKNPRPMWGWDKADNLKKRISNNKSFESQIGKAVLSSFLQSKKINGNDLDKEKITEFDSIDKSSYVKGGILPIKKKKFNDELIKELSTLFETRHSIRTFNNIQVIKSELERAIELAIKCPSACNRQPFHVYIIDGKDRLKKISTSNSFNADKYLYITGDISSFTPDEFNDWYISPAIFAAYLTMTMEIFGIGSCIMRKDLVRQTTYNHLVKKVCKIPNNEKLILEIAIGYYDDDILVPQSQRKNLKDVVTYV